jgi:hypothetical protein
MTINELHQHFVDLDFQASKMLKSSQIDSNYLSKYAHLAEIVKQKIVTLSISPEINEEVSKLGLIDISFEPKLSLLAHCENVLTFGYYKKSFQQKKREKYFRNEIQKRKLLFNYVEKQLKTI